MNWITVATLIHISAYLFYIGIIPSISDSYRTINDKRLYHAFFFVLAALVAGQGAYSRESLEIPYVIAGFCVFGLSMAAEFWKRDQGPMHILFTYVAICIGMILTILWIWPTWGIFSLLCPVILIGGGVLLQHVKNSTYWQEVLAIVTVFGPILFK